MTPDQFLQRVAKYGPAPAYLFIGPDTYRRAACRKALVERIQQLDRFDLLRILSDETCEGGQIIFGPIFLPCAATDEPL